LGPKGDYWLERTVFLLGAKFDVMTPQDGKGEPNASKDDLQIQSHLDKDASDILLQYYRPVNRYYVYVIYKPIKDNFRH
jgi:hypothetical protein